MTTRDLLRDGAQFTRRDGRLPEAVSVVQEADKTPFFPDSLTWYMAASA